MNCKNDTDDQNRDTRQMCRLLTPSTVHGAHYHKFEIKRILGFIYHQREMSTINVTLLLCCCNVTFAKLEQNEMMADLVVF